MSKVYLDNNSTTAALPEVWEAIRLTAEAGASNASSAQSSGDLSRKVLREVRSAVAELAGCSPENLFFTSSGTEANNWVLRAAAKVAGSRRCRIITSRIEHSSVLKTCEALEEEGVAVEYLPVNGTGVVSVIALEEMLENAATLVSVQWANNETGVIQPVSDIAETCHRHGVLCHTDAAQSIGKLRVDLSAVPVDFLSLSAHKWHGPSGVGAVYARNPQLLRPFLFGGDQERGLRPGTENILGLAGTGRAARIRAASFSDDCDHMRELRDEFERLLAKEIPGVQINGICAERVCNTSNVRFVGVDGQAMLAQLDSRGVYCSQGSACESMRPEPSHVLRAMGLNEREAYSSIRFSFSPLNTISETRHAVSEIVEVYRLLQDKSTARSVGAGLAGDK